jgi:hypothetical protein
MLHVYFTKKDKLTRITHTGIIIIIIIIGGAVLSP